MEKLTLWVEYEGRGALGHVTWVDVAGAEVFFQQYLHFLFCNTKMPSLMGEGSRFTCKDLHQVC